MGQGTTRRSRHLGHSDLELVPHLQCVRSSNEWGTTMSHTLRSGVHDNLRCEAEEDELEETDGEPEARPVMSVLHHLEAVTIEVDIALKVHVVEGLHGDLVSSTVLELIRIVLEC